MALTIHLGAHKTATTHLQQSLRQVRRELRQGGVFYAGPGVLRDRGARLERILGGHGELRMDSGLGRALAEVRHCLPEMLLSEENILGGTSRRRIVGPQGVFYPGAGRRLQRLIALAGGGPATLCLAVRDPASFNVSAFAVQLAYGKEIDIEDYLVGRDPARLDWAALVARLSAVPGVARIIVWRYEDYPALRPQILARMLPPGLGAIVPEAPRSNESITQAGYDWLLEQADASEDADLRALVHEARIRFGRAQGHGPMRPFADEVYARSAVCYAENVARLAELPGVELLLP
ncbi:MAG: hypothetical protein U1E41_07380 [Paracoccus sp. (in: a-proteobacteria)]|jgi:hypothetical protein